MRLGYDGKQKLHLYMTSMKLMINHNYVSDYSHHSDLDIEVQNNNSVMLRAACGANSPNSPGRIDLELLLRGS
jgi:hypothetical protein